MKKVLGWFMESNRWKHLLGGVAIGFCSNTNYCALYASVVAAGCLEYKDKARGGTWDWVDCGLTVAGGFVGRLIRVVVG